MNTCDVMRVFRLKRRIIIKSADSFRDDYVIVPTSSLHSVHPGTVLLGPGTVSVLLGLTSDGCIGFRNVPYFSHHTNPPARPLKCEEARPAVKVKATLSSLHPEIASLD